MDAKALRQRLRSSAPSLVKRIDTLAGRWLKPLTERLSNSGAAFRPKLVNDPIWGTIELLPWEVALLDTTLLQRMRGVRQLGLAQLVFPGACHDRLEHIIGVVGAVDVMLSSLDRHISRWNRDNKMATLPQIGDEDRYVLRLAALLHDLGHGPFSHAIEPVLERNAVLREDGASSTAVDDWRGDIAAFAEELGRCGYAFNAKPAVSELIAALLVVSDPLAQILSNRNFPFPGTTQPDELQIRIMAAVVGAVEGPAADHLGAVISGQIDADKLDYLQRDAHHAGLEIGFDTSRLLARLEVLQVRPDNIDASAGTIRPRVESAPDQKLLQVGIAASGFGSFEQMLIGRTFLYDRLYHHHKVRAAEAMAQRLILVAERDRPARFDFEDVFMDMGDEVVLRLFAGDVSRAGFQTAPKAAAIARDLLDRKLLHRAYALRGRFISVSPDIGSTEGDDNRRELWSRIVKDLQGLKDRYRCGEEIHDLAVRCCQILRQAGIDAAEMDRLAARLVEAGAEQIIVDLPALKADAIRIFARYPNGSLKIPEFSFNPVKWSNAYELQKRTSYVFCPRDLLQIVALAAKIVFFTRYGVAMAPEADGFIKGGGDIPPTWIEKLVAAGVLDETARDHLFVKRRSLVKIATQDLSIPADWLQIDEDFGYRLAHDLNEALSGGLSPDHRETLREVLKAVWRLLDHWHAAGDLTSNLENERDLQKRVRSKLEMAGLTVTEGLEVSGGETDLILNGTIVLENKIEGPTANPDTRKAAAGMQGRRYAIALNSRLVIVLLAYQPSGVHVVPNKMDSIKVRRITAKDRYQAEIRIKLPYGLPVPSRETADKSANSAHGDAEL